MNVLKLLGRVERLPEAERRKAMPRIDRDLKRAVTQDMAEFAGEVVSTVALRGGRRGVHSMRTRQFFGAFGWSEATLPYRRGRGGRPDAFETFGIKDKMTPFAAEEVARLGAGLGSFGEAARTLAALHCGRMSESKVRDATLAAGEAALKTCARTRPRRSARPTDRRRSRARWWEWRTARTRPA